MTIQKNVLIGKRTLLTLYALIAMLTISTIVIYPIYFNNVSAQTNNEYDDLNNYLNGYISTHTHNNSEYNDLREIVNLEKTQIIVRNLTITEPAGAYHTETFSVQYAGFILVNLTSSTTDQNSIEVIYTSQWFSYDNYVIIVGHRGISMFPVLPSNNVQVRIGTPNSSKGGNQTFTITYYY